MGLPVSYDIINISRGATTEFHRAVKNNDIQAVGNLLRNDASRELLLSKVPGMGEAALHLAVSYFHRCRTQQALEMIKLLLQTSTIFRSKLKDGPHLSISQGLFLREAGRKTLAFTTANTLLLERNHNGDTALVYAVSFRFQWPFSLPDLNAYELVKELVKILLNDITISAQERYELLSQTNAYGHNVLYGAMARGEETFELLLPYCAQLSLLAQKNAYGRTVLYKAVWHESDKMVALVLCYVSLDLLTTHDRNGENALHAAISRNYREEADRMKIVAQLVSHYAELGLLTEKNAHGRTVLD